MLDKFKKYIEKEGLCHETDNVLVTVSGGVDSISMMHLFLKAGYNIQLAHVNYKMRGNESDADEEMVKAMGKHYNITSHVITFPEHLKEKGNFQEKARTFRYDWFQKLCEENGLDSIATAHHKDDVMETFDENIPEPKYWKQNKRVFSIHSLEIDNLPTNYKLSNLNFHYALYDTENNCCDEEDFELYKQTLQSLDLKFEKKICIDKSKILSKFNLLPDDDLNKLFKMILTGDSPINCLRLYNVANIFNTSPHLVAKEIYDILFSFTYGYYFDFNADSEIYYRTMKFLRDNYHTDPKYK